MIGLYRRLAQRCRSPNQLNALHIALERHLTPNEFSALRAHGESALAAAWRSACRRLAPLRAEGSPAGAPWQPPAAPPRRWMLGLQRLFLGAGKARAEPFARRRLGPQLTLYTDGRNARAHKQLLLCFTGSTGRMFLPTPLFLQCLPARDVDVLMVGYRKPHGHRRGLPHLGPDFESTVDALRPLARLDDYRRCVALGTSGGGLAAVLAALQLGLPAALSAGGRGPEDPGWLDNAGHGVEPLLMRHAQALRTAPRIFLAYGGDEARDAASAQALARLIPATELPIREADRTVGHNVFLSLLRRGELTRLLASTVLDETAAPPRRAGVVQAGAAIATMPSASA